MTNVATGPSNEASSRPLSARQAISDILLVIASSALLFAIESWMRSRGLVNWGEDSRGVTAVLAGMATAVALVYFRGGSLRGLGLVRPRSWLTVPLWVVGILAAYFAMQVLVPRLVGFFIELPAPDLSRHAGVTGNLRAALTLALVLPFSASIPEEIIYRGFLMGRLDAVFGRHRTGTVATVLVQSLIFGSVHFGWGVGGMIVTTVMGAVWGTAYVLCGRNLWIMILAHSTGHLLLVAQLYAGGLT